LLISRENRLVVRRSAKHIRIQLVIPGPEGDSTLVSAMSAELDKFGYEGATGNTSAAYLTGLLFGKKALAEGYESGVLDIGLHAPSPGCRIYAALMGVVDAGMDIPHNPSVFPAGERIRGEHVADHLDMPGFPDMFDASKEKILAEFS
jgi:large subunit ribosomal protein L18